MDFDIEKLPKEFRDFLKPIMESNMLDQRIVDAIATKAGPDGISRVSQYRIAEEAGTIQQQVSNRLKRLVKLGFIRRKGTGAYTVLRRNVLGEGSVKCLLQYLEACTNDSSLLKLPLKDQAERTGLTVAEIKIAHGYMAAFNPVKK